MVLKEMDKYLKQLEVVDTVNAIGMMDMEELIEFIINGGDKQKILSMLDNNKRKEVEKLIEGGVV